MCPLPPEIQAGQYSADNSHLSDYTRTVVSHGTQIHYYVAVMQVSAKSVQSELAHPRHVGCYVNSLHFPIIIIPFRAVCSQRKKENTTQLFAEWPA